MNHTPALEYIMTSRGSNERGPFILGGKFPVSTQKRY